MNCWQADSSLCCSWYFPPGRSTRWRAGAEHRTREAVVHRLLLAHCAESDRAADPDAVARDHAIDFGDRLREMSHEGVELIDPTVRNVSAHSADARQTRGESGADPGLEQM